MIFPYFKSGLLALLLLAALGYGASAFGQESSKDAKVIYGADDRIDVYEETNPEQLARVRATCGLIRQSSLLLNGDGTYTISAGSYSVSRDLCPSEPFASQPAAMFCTGFMVGARRITTAGHCLSADDIDNVAIVFGFEMLDASTPVTTVNADQVYFPTTIISQADNGVLDYCVVDVDRDITSPGASPLPLRTEGTIALGEQVGVIGHPAGIPMKVAFGTSTVVTVNDNANYFEANLDTYGGNSGSPVFNQSSGLVEGILVYGADDFISAEENGEPCQVSNELDDSAGSEGVTRSSVFAGFVSGAEGEGDGVFEGAGEGVIEGAGEGVIEGEGEGILEGEGALEGEGTVEGEGVAEGEGEGELLDLCDYWPIAFGNKWQNSLGALTSTHRIVGQTYIETGYVFTLRATYWEGDSTTHEIRHYRLTDQGLYSADSIDLFFNFPNTFGLRLDYPREITLNEPIPVGGASEALTPKRGKLSDFVDMTELEALSIPDHPDVLVFANGDGSVDLERVLVLGTGPLLYGAGDIVAQCDDPISAGCRYIAEIQGCSQCTLDRDDQNRLVNGQVYAKVCGATDSFRPSVDPQGLYRFDHWAGLTGEFPENRVFANRYLPVPVYVPIESGEGIVDGEGVTEGTPEGEGSTDGEGLIEGTPEGEGTVDGEGVAEGTPDGEGGSEGATEGEGTPDGEGGGDGEGVVDGEGTVDGEGSADGEGGEDPDYERLLQAFAAADADEDRMLSLAEVQTQVPAFAQQDLDDADANGDGKLSVAELLEFLGAGILSSADTNGDSIVQLTELLRLIQLYNAGLYACADNAGATEDGFALTAPPSEPACVLHSVDQNGDKAISLSELLRGIQLYNFGGYTWCPDGGTEDGFCG